MVDTQSRYRLYGYHYNYQAPRRPIKTSRDVHHLVASNTPEVLPPIEHDCRASFLRKFTDRNDWKAFVLGHGMKRTVESVAEIHSVPAVKIRPEKLLITVGDKGRGVKEFNYPRAIAVDSIGDVYIADSHNDRLQVYNGHGVYKHAIGDSDDGVDFKEPSGIAVFPNDDLAVADRKNKRIRVLFSDGALKFDVPTKDEPYSVSCDIGYNIIVSTYSGTVELYRRGGIFYNRFTISDTACPLVCNLLGEIVVWNGKSKKVEFYNHEGVKLHEFKPVSSCQGLGVVNSGIALDKNGHILLSDSLNHTITVFNERGILQNRHLGPQEDLGSVQACVVSPHGHLLALEFSSTGRHCLKIFRYTDCECHPYHKSPLDE